ncbi:hypothetical protein [Arthrobacter globiformis]|uniref:hypothetical protein n=1 Tax=Arthrobacter globiformis TaxID=1665 RepID=UPI0027906DF3|nr:hypothetical protein [Arthrobacter globiformis]MDQ0618609.1 hypothetical protein [Arthrobacter globiformis]
MAGKQTTPTRRRGGGTLADVPAAVAANHDGNLTVREQIHAAGAAARPLPDNVRGVPGHRRPG